MSSVATPHGGGPPTTMLHPMSAAAQGTSPSGKPKSSILYSTGRSVSITTATLEPTYPWDLDDDEDEGLDDDDDDLDDDDDDEDDDIAGDLPNLDQDFQHPSLETSRHTF